LEADPITGKPRPTARNLNIPLGEIANDLRLLKPEVRFLIFPKGEKHPIQFLYSLKQVDSVYFAPGSPEITTNHLITYNFMGKNTLNVLINDTTDEKMKLLPPKISAKACVNIIAAARKIMW
jgi:hypothetical protein